MLIVGQNRNRLHHISVPRLSSLHLERYGPVDYMKNVLGKHNFLSTTICLLAALFALVSVSSFHRVSDENKTEIVEIDFEQCETITERQKRRQLKFDQPSVPSLEKLLADSFLRTELRFFRPPIERDRYNGFGGFLRT